MSRFTNSITAFRITQPADTPIWPAIIFTRDNTAVGRLTVRRTIAFVGGDFRVLRRFNPTSPFFTAVVQHCQALFSFISALLGPPPLPRLRKVSQSLNDAVIRIWDEAGNVIETYEQAGDLFKAW